MPSARFDTGSTESLLTAAAGSEREWWKRGWGGSGRVGGEEGERGAGCELRLGGGFGERAKDRSERRLRCRHAAASGAGVGDDVGCLASGQRRGSIWRWERPTCAKDSKACTAWCATACNVNR